jgi:anti-anti-sigma factor
MPSPEGKHQTGGGKSWSEHFGLRVEVGRNGDASATVRLAGEFEVTSVEFTRCAVERAEDETKQIVLDLSRLTFFDVSGAMFLLEAQERARATGREIVVHHPSRAVRRVLELTGTLPLLCPGEPGDLPSPGVLDSDLVSVCDTAVAAAIRASGADMGNAQLVDPASRVLRIVAQHGFERPFLDFFEIVHDEDSACGAALAGGLPVWIPDVAKSPVFAGKPALDVMLEAGCQAVASVPALACDGSVLAMISVHRRRPTAWNDQQSRSLKG